MNTILNKSGYVTPQRQAELDRVKARQARNSAAANVQALCRECGIWDRYAGASLDDLKLPEGCLTGPDFVRYQGVVDELKSLFDQPGMIVLHGQNGPGKTYLASATVLAFCRSGQPAFFTTATDFFVAIKSTFGERGRTQEDVIRRFRNYELLAVDEIEVRSESAWENNLLRDLINARYSSLKSTVLITNKTADELTAGYLCPAILDRLKDEGAMLACDWPSLRGVR